ncbi:type I polyketide synthase [Micromonospora eburnea]|uniref:Myxalamid-type polyketide synthase MxaB n=1 Tax=Micromonospora eburnea TaxID=227316 RepID=A0A1C6V0G4_9ACTN|nr:type I polyketide synthase [Micromonospora eburnea]SCL59753.1 myxalamid-type polyketide synthase MxaB [Micromonospora eburnea]
MTGRGRAAQSEAWTPTGTPVAVVGIGCRFPGANGLTQFWQLLSSGGDAITEVPASRYDIDAYHDPRPGTPNRIVSRGGGFLDQIDRFDAGFFGVAPREAERMDPQQRLLLETAAEAMADAGLTRDRLSTVRAGVYIGGMSSAYGQMLSDAGALDLHAATGGARSFLAGRVSFAFDLRGPSVSVDCACSSSLAALHLAYRSVRTGETQLALAGGVNLVISPEETIPFSAAKMLAADGRCKFGSAHGDGFVRSEGVAVLVLKPLDRAEADGDAIHAVIYGSAVGNDGQSGGYLLTPSQPGQEETLRAAYADAGVAAGRVDYVEAHGTGTAAGDPVELGALGAVTGEGRAAQTPCLVGSVKTNIGHTEAVAGLAGVIKAILALQHREIPPSLHAAELTGAVDWAGLRLRLVRERTPWPQTGRPGLAGVSSFGISGTNAHVVLGEYRRAAATAPAPAGGDEAQLLVLSAHTQDALAALAAGYAQFLEPGGAGRELPLRDVCFSAATRRDHHESRLTAVGASPDELAERLRAYVAGESRPRLGATASAPVEGGRPRTVFVFPGQGSQWEGMGRELLASSPVFREVLTRCDEVIRSEAGWSLLDRLTGAVDAPASIDTIQPTLWAMETALCALLRDWGIEPDHVVGHSMGEVAAACASGALSLADAGAVICRRSRLLKAVAGQGAMYSVELSVVDAQAALAGHEDLVSVAASNSPTSTVISGDPQALATIVESLDERGVFCRQVKVDVASHSPQMDRLREDLLAGLADVAPGAGRIPLYSTVDDASCDGSGLDAAYWVRNLREPVRFGAAVAGLAGQGETVFVEISPHPILLPAIREVLALTETDGIAVGCLRRDEPERACILDTVGALHRAGCPVDWHRVFGGPSPRYVRLPSYPWQRRRYWFAPPSAAAEAEGPARHRVERVVDLARERYLLDHQVQGTVVMPGTAYVEMVHSAAGEICGGHVPLLRDIRYVDALFLRPDHPAPALATRFTSSGPDTWDFEVTGEEATHVTGTVTRTPPPEERRLPLDPVRAACPGHRTGAEFYRRFAARGNEWRGTFQGIAELWVGDGQALGRIQVPTGVDPTGYTCHPALLDACGQVLASLIPAEDRSSAFVLGSIDEVLIHPNPGTPGWAHAVAVTAWRSDSFCGDLMVSDADGRVIVEIKGLRLQYLQPPDSVRNPDDWFHELRWQPLPALPDAARPGGRRLVFADRSGVGAALDAEVRVYAGAGYQRLASGRYEIDPTAPAEYRRLLADVRAHFDGLAPTEVVHLWALDADQPDASAPVQRLAEDAERLGCASVLRLLRALADAGLPEPPRLALVTRGAYRVLDTDRSVSMWQGAIWGLGRVIAHEHRELSCALVDLDPAGPPAELAAALGRELTGAGPEDQLALRGGQRYAARLLPSSVGAGRPDGAEVAHQVRATVPGMLDGMRLVPVPRRAPGPGEVEVRADYLALNYRDVLVSMDMYPSMSDRPAIVIGECAGTVARVGPGVAGLRPGDEVVAISLETPAATYMCVNAHLVRRRPARLTAQEAASVPVGLVTAYQSLVHLAQLRPGERVLIHHATGGVGMAAVQVARWRGAEVYATAGSPEKRAMLRMMGVAHVSDSRSTGFADEIREATRGEGVDVVLNTLAGEGLLKSVELLADRGRYVELSRRDLVEGTRLDMRLLARGASFFVVDVVDLGLSDPRRLGAIMDETLALVQAGVLEPLPHRVFPAAELVGAFRHMAQARHIGKVLVSTEELTAPKRDETPAMHRPVRIDPAAGYLVTGGLGDLGVVVTDWLVREGARHIVLTGRTPLERTGGAGWLEELRRHGVRVAYEAVDVADEEAMRAVVRHHEQDGVAIRGVVHAAGVIEYCALSDLDDRVLSAVLRPKVTGAAVLHRLFAERALDFFVLFSSGSAVLSSPMLGAYAAANAALDSLADQRRLAGLTALSVNWGFWSVGMPARAGQQQGRAINPTGMDTFSPREGIEALRLLLARGATHGVVLPADWQRWATAHPDAAASPLLRDLLAGPTAEAAIPAPTFPARAVPRVSPAPTPTSPPPADLADTGNADADTAAVAGNGVVGTLTDRAAVERYLAQVLADVLGMPSAQVHPRRPLKRQGLDSLMAVEVRTRVQRDLGMMLPIAKMLGGHSVAELAGEVFSQLGAPGRR